MLELGSRQNMMDMDTKQARGKCTANGGLSALLNFLV